MNEGLGWQPGVPGSIWLYPHGCGEQVLLICRFRCFYGPYPRTWGTVVTGDQAAEMRQLNPILKPEDILIKSD
jgi:hypothetical protein